MLKKLLPVCIAAVVGLTAASAFGRMLPDPSVDMDPAAVPHKDTAVFAGGCFWGVEAVFEQLAGVDKVLAGFSGGEASTAHYEIVSEGRTGHAESVEITYDPAKVSYGQLLKVFFAVAHDPTEKNRQGPDTGTQYRSAIFYRDAEQQRIAEAYVAQLRSANVFDRPIVTRVTPLKAFYKAEEYHQDYAERHPHDLYIVYNDAPKVAHLQQQFPELYR